MNNDIRIYMMTSITNEIYLNSAVMKSNVCIAHIVASIAKMIDIRLGVYFHLLKYPILLIDFGSFRIF